MVRLLLVGSARLVFNAAMLAFLLGLVLVYCSYRLVRGSLVPGRGMPAREAGFRVLIALVELARALREQPGFDNTLTRQ